MTDRDIIERGDVYRALLDTPAWILLESETRGRISELRNISNNDLENPCTIERAKARGMESVLEWVFDAIAEADELLGKDTADQV